MSAPLSRRAFVRSAAALGAAALAPRVGLAQSTEAPAHTLVLVFLRGALDGLHAVPPYADPHYARSRPRLALPAPDAPSAPGRMLALDAQFGLHPKLGPLLPMYQSGELAFVHAVGTPDRTRSHFEAERALEDGQFTGIAASEGFAARALTLIAPPAGPDFRALAFTPVLPAALQGAPDALALAPSRPAALSMPGGRAQGPYERALAALYPADGDPLERSGARVLSRLRELRARFDAPVNARPPAEQPLAPPGRGVSQPLHHLARYLRAGVAVQLAWIDVGGYDTHTDQGDGERGRLAGLFDELAAGLNEFRANLGPRWEHTTVLTLTEFGRTVNENGSGGTDHGHGGVSLVAGGSVRGGRVYGSFPGLAPEQRHERRDLAVTTDLRDVLRECLRGGLGYAGDAASDARLFPGFSPAAPLGLFRSA